MATAPCTRQQPVRWPSTGRSTVALALGLLLAVVAAAVLPSLGRPTAAERTPLRFVDWPATLAGDPAISIDPAAYRLPGINGPYVRLHRPSASGDLLKGYALTEDATFADLDGDGADEAIIPVASGGTAGLLGFLLYREDLPAPRLAVIETGYKMSFVVDGNRLVLYHPNYVGFEPNCCPSSMTRTTTALEGDALVVFATEVEPNDVQELTVAAFYRALADRKYDEAYAFLSPGYQASNPFEAWRDGFAATQSVEVDTAPGASPTEVEIDLRAVDRRPGGGTVTQRFRGTWTLVWSGEQRRWLLDRPRIQAV